MRFFKDPLLFNFITLGIIIIFVAYGIGANLEHGEKTQWLLDENRKAGEERSEQLLVLQSIVEQQGNLSQDARAKIISSIIQNEQVLIPSINHTLAGINQTLDVIRDAAPQSNFTAQRIATERIENMTRDIAQIEGILNS